ncbi:MAG: hypoxanthine phosphoribosyltransferase [Candidatus Korobacteraceae bacterium]
MKHSTPPGDPVQLKLLLSREQIAHRVGEMASEISRDFAGESVILVGVLKGASVFLSDLARQITLDATFDFISVASYGDGTRSTGEVRLNKDVDSSLAGRNVIMVEDILDTGLTMTFLRKLFLARQPRALKIAVLLDKTSRRLVPVHPDYIGFSVGNEFVVGYGMDFGERYRNLPDIRLLPEELIPQDH